MLVAWCRLAAAVHGRNDAGVVLYIVEVGDACGVALNNGCSRNK